MMKTTKWSWRLEQGPPELGGRQRQRLVLVQKRSSGGSRDSTRWRELAGEVQDAQNAEEEAGWRCGDLLILDGDGAREKGSGGEA